MSEADSPSTDRALWLAVRAWGIDDLPGFWSLFADDWRNRVGRRMGSTRVPSGEALEMLEAEHLAQVRPDLGRVHPSWLERALQGETAAVRSSVGIPKMENGHPGPSHPEVRAWANVLWTERLVGDVQERSGDPEVLKDITKPGGIAIERLAKDLALAKLVYAGEASMAGNSQAEGWGQRIVRYERLLGSERVPRLVTQAKADIAAAGAGEPTQLVERLGTLSLARLLSPLEPYRLRWVLQHIPYATAREVRRWLQAKPPRDHAGVLDWEVRLYAVVVMAGAGTFDGEVG